MGGGYNGFLQLEVSNTLTKLIRAPLTRLLLLLVAWTASSTLGEEPVGFQVVVHSSNPVESVTAKRLSRIFLKKRLSWESGLESRPVDQDESSPVRVAFTRVIHGKSVTSITSFWQRQVYSGRSAPPPELGSDQEVLEYLRQTPGAVGYISSETQIEGDVKVLEIGEPE